MLQYLALKYVTLIMATQMFIQDDVNSDLQPLNTYHKLYTHLDFIRYSNVSRHVLIYNRFQQRSFFEEALF